MASMPTDRLPQGDEKRTAVREMFDTIAPRYDMVNRIMTFRMDVGWRKRAMKELRFGPGDEILDLACGTGDFCVSIEEANANPIGIDLSFGMLANARTDAPLVQGDLLQLPIADESVQGAVCGFALRNLVSLPPFFEELARTIKPGGRVVLLDVASPNNRILKFGHNLYFNKVVPMIGGLLSDKTAYSYLPRSVSYLPARDVLLKQLETAGFVDAEHIHLRPGSAQIFAATKPHA